VPSPVAPASAISASIDFVLNRFDIHPPRVRPDRSA
jgi:hypothetical protein